MGTDTATTTTTDTATTTTDTATTTATASTRAVELERSLDLTDFPNAIVTTSTGHTVDITAILPSKVLPMGEEYKMKENTAVEMLHADGIFSEDQNMQSGKIEWKEMAVQGLHSCGRSNLEKRPRFIALAQETVEKNL